MDTLGDHGAMKMNRVSAGRGGIVSILGLTILVTGFVAIIVTSPWLARSVVHQSDDWRALSDIGQAYGGVSAILSALALCGIAASLIFQWRQVRFGRVIAARERNFELVKLGLEDPELMLLHREIPPSEARRWSVINLWVSYWAMLWDTGAIRQSGLRGLFDDLFRQNPAALDWWAGGASVVWNSGYGMRRKVFQQVAEEAYGAALASAASRSSDQDGTASRASVGDEPPPPPLDHDSGGFGQAAPS